MGEQVQDRQSFVPGGQAFLDGLLRRHRRARRWQVFFLASLVVGLLALLALFANVADETFGTIAVASKYSEAEVLAALSEAKGVTVEGPLEALGNDDLARVLALYIPRRVPVIMRDELSRVKPEDFTRVPLREALAGATLPPETADMTISQLSLEQQTAILSANLTHDALYARVLNDVIGLDILKSWTLSRTLFDYAGIEAEFQALVAAQNPPNPQLKSHSWLNTAFITGTQSSYPELAGIRTAILGTLWIMALTMIIAFPLGVGAAIYLEEYAHSGNWLERLIETNIRNLAGVPSIIYGLLGLAIFVRALAPISSGALFGINEANGRTIFAAAMTMALLILPVIIIAAQEAIRAVPQSIRDASYGLGATQWQTIWYQVLPAALPGILTGTILSMSRAIGETAPLIVIGASAVIFVDPSGPFSKFTALPIQIWQWTARPQEEFRNLAAAAIIVLLALLLMLNSVAIILRQRVSNRLRS